MTFVDTSVSKDQDDGGDQNQTAPADPQPEQVVVQQPLAPAVVAAAPSPDTRPKRHRARSRSMPNLVYYEPKGSKVLKHQHKSSVASGAAAAVVEESCAKLNSKYLSMPEASTAAKAVAANASCTSSVLRRARIRHSKTPSTSSTSSASTSSSAATAASAAASSSSSSSASTSSSPPLTACPNTPVQLPPVNSHSLREIDLQEIFKNPQLRHDIIFDPQLQFRPNLDGERGKRKRVVAERYWDAIVIEFEQLNQGVALSPMSRLPLMFHTLRDILLSLLPLKDRSHVDSILDPDLIMQQVRYGALDFVSMASWLADVFKAHCAPMRDAWVDQMVCRVELGIQSRSPRRLVEGLRMVFAILEAMKLDVANHQIRTLRPMLVDTAIEFEQDYYTQIVDKGKLSLTDSLNWFRRSLKGYEASNSIHHDVTTSNDVSNQKHHRAGFVWGLLRLFSCSLDEIVTEFPSTFGFDFSRLVGYRAELRKIVCLNLCILLYKQMVQTAASHDCSSPGANNKDTIDKLKTDVLAITEDSLGNSKWTKNTQTLALEIARRASGNKVPPSAMTDIASGWLTKHLQPKSELYKMVEAKTNNQLHDMLMSGWAVLSSLDSTTTVSTHFTGDNSIASSPLLKEIVSLGDRVLVLVRFHWGVFAKFYATYVMMGDAATASIENVEAPNPCNVGLEKVTSGGAPDEDEVRLAAGQMRHQSTSAC